MVKGFLEVSIGTSLLPDYVPYDTLDDDTPDGDNGNRDNNDDENHNYDNNENNVGNHLNDDNDYDNDNKYDNDDDDQTIMIFQTMHFVELLICEKAAFMAFTHIYMHRQILLCLHSVNPCLIYSRAEIFERS